MKKFSFSLERVLTYKEQVEQSLRNEHGQAVKKVRDKEEEISCLEDEFVQFRESAGPDGIRQVSAARLRGRSDYMNLLIGRIGREKKALGELKKEEEQKREAVIHAKQETQSIQMLRDKKKQEYDAAEAKARELEIEEFVSNRMISAKGKD